MTMDNDKMEKLKDMLNNGDLDQETYDEIVRRWEGEGGSSAGSEDKKVEEKAPGRERSKKVSVAGAGNLSDVYTHEFNGSGSVKISGYLDADRIDISGAGHIDGDVKSSELIDVSGAIRIAGKVDAKEIDSSGSMKAEEISCYSIESSGSLQVQKGLRAESMDVSGGTRAETIEAETLKSSGALGAESVSGGEVYISGKIQTGSVTCRRFEMEIYSSSSRIGKLEADAIDVKQARRFFHSGKVEIADIKCKRALLEGVISKSVVGEEIIVGDDCDIEYVEGRNVKISENARVKEKKILS